MELHARSLELHASSLICMQTHGTAFKLIELHASSWNYMYASLCNVLEPWGTFWNLEKGRFSNWLTDSKDRQTDIRTRVI